MNRQLKLIVITKFLRTKYDRIHEVTHYIRDQLGQTLLKVTKPSVFTDLSCACYNIFVMLQVGI